MRKKNLFLFFLLVLASPLNLFSQKGILVFQTDFGLKDGAVSEMKGVAMGISSDLKIYDITHEIPPYNIWESAYRLYQTASYWPSGTVFVSVIDPGVGTSRKSVVLKTKNNLFFVGPDNGQFTLIAKRFGIDQIYEIDEKQNRLKGTEKSYTFHGRDLYAYTGARLAAKVIALSGVGNKLPNNIVTLNFQEATYNNGVIRGNIPILDVQFGSIWTNIDAATFKKLNVSYGDTLHVLISHGTENIFEGNMPYANTFFAVDSNQTLCYLNSLLHVAFAINMGNFSRVYHVSSGPDWNVEIRKVSK